MHPTPKTDFSAHSLGIQVPTMHLGLRTPGPGLPLLHFLLAFRACFSLFLLLNPLLRFAFFSFLSHTH